MEPSLWQHQTIERVAAPVAHGMTPQAFVAGVLVGVILAAVLLWRPSRSKPKATRHRPLRLSGWGDLFRLLGGALREVLWLIGVLLLLARVVLWPAGRRW